MVQNFCETHSISNFSKVSSVDSEKLKQLKCQHPLRNLGFDHSVSLFEAEHVTDEAGTGLVHIAPNHGVEDFEVGIKNDLDNLPTVDNSGVYTDNVPFFSGTHVYKADESVINELKKFKYSS